jgi:hypothetical protein
VEQSTLALFDVKTCGKCGRSKPRDLFPRQGRTCRACHRIYSAQHYRQNREKRIAYAVEYAKRKPSDLEKRRVNERRRYAARKRDWGACSVPECGHPVKNKTLQVCSPHYTRYRLTGVVGGPVRERRMARATTGCSVDGCDGAYEARGLCRPHYLSQHWSEGLRAASRRRRARKLQLPSEPYTLADIIARDGIECVLCGEELDLAAVFPDRRTATIEHLECLSWPDSSGDVLANVAASHLSCNNRRCNKPHPAAARKRAELAVQVTHA